MEENPELEIIERPPIRPGQPTGAPPTPNAMVNYFSGSIPKNLQHDVNLVNTKYGTPAIASLPLFPAGPSGTPTINSAITNILNNQVAVGPAPPPFSVQWNNNGIFGGSGNLTYHPTPSLLQLIGPNLLGPGNFEISDGRISDFISTPSTYQIGVPSAQSSSFLFRGTGNGFWWGEDGAGALVELNIENTNGPGDGVNLLLSNVGAGLPGVSATALAHSGLGYFQVWTLTAVNNALRMEFTDNGISFVAELNESGFQQVDFDINTGDWYPDFNPKGIRNNSLGTSVSPWTNLYLGTGVVNFQGATSGDASIGVADIAGTPDILILPIATATPGYVLSSDGGSPQQLSWVANGGGGGGTPGAPDGSIQGNNSGSFGGTPGSLIDFTTGAITLTAAANVIPLTIVGDSVDDQPGLQVISGFGDIAQILVFNGTALASIEDNLGDSVSYLASGGLAGFSAGDSLGGSVGLTSNSGVPTIQLTNADASVIMLSTTELDSTSGLLIAAPTVGGAALSVVGSSFGDDIQDWYTNGSLTPVAFFDTTGNLNFPTAGIIDSTASLGTSGQVLSSTGSQIVWVDAATGGLDFSQMFLLMGG